MKPTRNITVSHTKNKLRSDSDELFAMMVVHPLAQVGAGRRYGHYRMSDLAPRFVRTSAIVCAGVAWWSERTLTVLWPFEYR